MVSDSIVKIFYTFRFVVIADMLASLPCIKHCFSRRESFADNYEQCFFNIESLSCSFEIDWVHIC